MAIDFDNSPSVLLTVLTNRMNLNATRELREAADVSITEWAVLAVAAAEPGAPPQRVIDVSALDKSVVSRAIKALAARRLIEVRAHPSHRRKTTLHLTAAGRATHDICRRIQHAGDRRMLEGLKPFEVAQALELFRHLTRQINDLLMEEKVP